MLLTQELDKEIDIFVASRIGSFKHIKYHSDQTKNNKKCTENLVEIKSLQKDDAITSMAWGTDEQTEILLGKKNQQIHVYDTTQGFTKCYAADFGTGDIVGLGRHDGKLVAALSGGAVAAWGEGGRVVLRVGARVDSMRLHADGLFATGGEENDLKVWRMGERAPVFAAKNLPHDWLQLRRPVWVSDLCFLGADSLAVCSRHGYVRLYDTRAQRRPVCHVDTQPLAATCIAPSFHERQVFVGFGRGQLHQVDLRQGRLDKGYKGATGAITSLALARDELLVSVSLDRHLRIHRQDTKELIHKQYMTSKLSCVLVQTEGRTPLRDPPGPDGMKREARDEGDVALDMDHIFDGMETVGDVPTKKRTESPDDETPKKKKLTASVKDEDEDAIKRLLRKTEKQKRKLDKKKKQKKAKSVFHNA